LWWGISAALGRAAFTGRLLPHGEALAPIDPLILSQSRVGFSCVIVFLVLLASRGWRGIRLSAGDFGRMVVLGVLGVAASNYFYYLAIQRTNVGTAIILQYTAPVWVLLYTVTRGQQKASLPRISAVVLAMTGIALVLGIFSGSRLRLDLIGVGSAILAAFSFAFYNVYGHNILTRLNRWMVLLYTLFSASLFWMVVNPPWKVIAAHYSGTQWLFLLIFSLVSVMAPFSFYFAGLQHLEPTRAIVVSCLEPVFSILLAAALLGEIMRPVQALGIALVLTAIIVVQLPDGKGATAAMIEPIE
jgi:drug/metabolite transporter, DME family